MLDVEAVLLEELDRLAPPHEVGPPAWDEIVRRAKASRRHLTPRRAGLYALAAAIVVYLAAPAFGLGTPFADFFSSKPAPKQAVKDFEQQNAVGAHGFGVDPKILAGEARRITVYRLRDGRPFALDVAPRRGGGFCFDFASSGSCAGPRGARGPKPPDRPGDHNVAAVALVIIGYHRSSVLAGYVYDKRIAKLVVRFRRQRPVDVPLLWVGPPIDAGFFAYNLTEFQRTHHNVAAVVAVDARGKEIARVSSVFGPRPAWANWRKVAELSRKHVVLRSGRSTVAIAPSRAGGNCFWLHTVGKTSASGCTPPRFVTQPLAGDLSGTAFFAQVKAAVARVELRFQDGVRSTLRPVDGFALYSIPKSHWQRGHRLVAAIAYSSSGKRLARQGFDPRMEGVYPCSKPRPIGAGLKVCP
jgi:hypothetical protein